MQMQQGLAAEQETALATGTLVLMDYIVDGQRVRCIHPSGEPTHD